MTAVVERPVVQPASPVPVGPLTPTRQAVDVVSTTATVFGANEYGSGLSGILSLPIALWEFSLGVYLVVKGFRAAGLQKLGFAPAPADELQRAKELKRAA